MSVERQRRVGEKGVQAAFETTDELRALLTDVAEEVSLGFDRWSDEYVRGPSLYFLVVSGVSFDSFADPLGGNRWPVEQARHVQSGLSAVVSAARTVAFEHDGAVVVTADGTIQEQMVRVRTPGDRHLVDGDYPTWMSAKHLSALEVSAETPVLSVITLSEEDGRVVVFEDGQYHDRERAALGGRWRARAEDATEARGADRGERRSSREGRAP